MDGLSFDLDDPSNYKSLRDLIAPSLANHEQTGPPSARHEVERRGDVPSKVPSVLLPSRYGDQSTWTQPSREYNEDLRKLLVDAELRPFASAAQRTAAIVDAMLRHPAVFSPRRRVNGPSTGDKIVDGPPSVSPRNAPTNANPTFTAINRKGKGHSEASRIDPATAGITDGGDKHTLSQIIRRLDIVLNARSSIQKRMSQGLPRNPTVSGKKQLEHIYTRNLRKHLGENNSALARGGQPKRYAGKVDRCETEEARKYKQELLSTSIDIQIVLGELIGETKGKDVVIELMLFAKASVDSTWSAEHSNTYEVELARSAKKASKEIQMLFGGHLQTPNATYETPESKRPHITPLQSSFGQTNLPTGAAARTQSDTRATQAPSAPYVRPSVEGTPDESLGHGTEPADICSKHPLHAYKDHTQHSIAPGSSLTGQSSSVETKSNVMLNLELQGSEDRPQLMQFMEHHDRDQFFQSISKAFKGKDVKSVTVTISSVPTSNDPDAPDAPDVSWRTWKYNVGKGDSGVSTWAVLRSDLVKTQKSYETVVVKALVYWR